MDFSEFTPWQMGLFVLLGSIIVALLFVRFVVIPYIED
jgi:hypothetical protein